MAITATSRNMSRHVGLRSIRKTSTRQPKKWINELKENLAPKTIREVITRLASIHELWRQENKIPYNPFENIVIKQLDNLEPDPFSKTEILMILGAMANQDIQNLLPCIFWTGLSISDLYRMGRHKPRKRHNTGQSQPC